VLVAALGTWTLLAGGRAGVGTCAGCYGWCTVFGIGAVDRSVQLCSMGRRGCWCVGVGPVGRICCFAREMSPRERAANEWLWGVTRRTGHWALDDVASYVANVLYSDSVSTVKTTKVIKWQQ
jgi:hypothetical protein